MNTTIEEAARLLMAHSVIAVPTETVYGLAASMHSDEAIHRLFTLKRRPRDNPLIVHVSTFAQLDALTDEINDTHRALMQRFWPGPLTLIFKARREVSSLITCGLNTVAVRMPKSEKTRALIDRVGPIVAPSANISGKPSATTPEHVESDFGTDFPILYDGPCHCGIESTVVQVAGGICMIARDGAISADVLRESGFTVSRLPAKEKPIAPGQKYRHYSPATPLTLLLNGAHTHLPCILGYSDRQYATDRFFNLGRSTHPEEIAERLYACLRALDEANISSAAIDGDLPESGMYVTIKERMRKAAHSD